jgi:hypothetical protein
MPLRSIIMPLAPQLMLLGLTRPEELTMLPPVA